MRKHAALLFLAPLLFIICIRSLFSEEKHTTENKEEQTAAVPDNFSPADLLPDVYSPDDLTPAEEETPSGDKTEQTPSETQDILPPETPVQNVQYVPLDIPGADRAEVEKYRRKYIEPYGAKWLYKVLDDAEPYRLYVRKALADRGMPSVLEYLPVVESSYKPSARSHAGALGLWQFMANSTKPFLLRNDFIDERLDPWKSTDAALTKLQENYKIFGDWPIAIAAYNCGAGAMARILRKSPQKDFWYLAEHKLLRDQSVQYVPKLLAIADLAQNSTFYGINLPTAEDADGNDLDIRAGDFDYVAVKECIELRRLASELRMDDGMLAELNPALLRGITPPGKEYSIRLPSGMAEAAGEALLSIKPFKFSGTYTVVAGDTLWGISRKFDISVESLCDVNNISEKSLLKIGKILYIPKK